jgi:hypothetical protein
MTQHPTHLKVRAAVLTGALAAITSCASEIEPASPEPQALHQDLGAGPASESDFFASVRIDDKDSLSLPSLGDLWVNCWSDDDAVYTTSGDGIGLGNALGDIVVSRVDGRPGDKEDPLRGTSLTAGDSVGPLWNPIGYSRKPTGMLCVHGDLYLAIQDLTLLTFSDAPAATIAHSPDKGRTWTWDRRAPMFSDHVFTTIMFLDFGKDSEHAPDGYVYAYGLDDNWSAVYSDKPPQTKLYLARVPSDKVMDRSAWEFFSGLDAETRPTWSKDIAQRAAALEDTRRLYAEPLDPSLDPKNMTTLSQGGVVYNAALKRYIYSTWTMYTFELYEAPEPWGPWRHFHSKDFGVFPWTEEAAGGYGTTLPSKFISQDGHEMWMHSNVWQAGVIHYEYSLRKVEVAPFVASSASNTHSADSLATAEQGAVPLVRVARTGHPEILNDGKLRDGSELSWNGEHKHEDYWGYTWPHAIHVNEVRYTTGAVDARGGWFEELSVQLRQDGTWVDASHLEVTPRYSANASVLGNQTFVLRFDEAVADGVRIYGKPGGRDSFTNIAELSVHYE